MVELVLRALTYPAKVLIEPAIATYAQKDIPTLMKLSAIGYLVL